MTDEEKPQPVAGVPLDASDRNAKRAERWAARKKARAEGQEQGGGGISSTDSADKAARAERWAARKKARAPVQEAAIAPSPEAKTEALADRKARRAAKREAKAQHAASNAAPTPAPTQTVSKSQRKAAKRQAKLARRSQTEQFDNPAIAAPVATAASGASSKAERKAARKAAKAQRKAQKSGAAVPLDPAALAEKRAAKAARKAAKRAAKAEAKPGDDGEAPGPTREERKQARAAKKAARQETGDDEGPRPFRFKVFSSDPQRLGAALADDFAAAGVTVEARDEGKLDLAVHDFDAAPDAEAYAAGMPKARIHVLIDRGGASSDALITLAKLTGAAIVHAGANFERLGGTGENPEKLIADWILALARARSKKAAFAPPPRHAPPDLAQLREACGKPADVLAQIKAVGALPKSLSARPSQDEVENLADSRIALNAETTLPLETPFNWQRELPDRRSISTFYGLDFLIGPFAYWYAKAQGQTGEQLKAIDDALKARGRTLNSLLARAMLIVDDFVAKHPREDGGPAWQDQAVIRRTRVLLLYVLCCKAALKRKIAFNEAAFTQVARALFDHIEILRGDDRYTPVSRDGIELDGLLIGVAQSLRGLPYAAKLLEDSLTRIKRLQLDCGLTQEGVWQGESFSDHCGVLAEISGLCANFAPAQAQLAEPLSSAAKRMTAFAEAMLKCNGEPPGIDDSRERSYVNRLMGARRKLAKAAGKKTLKGKQPLRKRITDTYVFREAQYFISHSSTAVEPDSSLVVLHANPPSLARHDPGGITLVFAHGEDNLLVRGASPEDGDEDSRADPALRNGIRIDGAGCREPESGSEGAVRIAKSWRGPGWAAARGIEANHEGGSIARTAIHFKAAHALLVVDELESADGAEHEFAQHWNIASDFVPAQDGPLHFQAEQHGTLNLAVCPAGDFAREAGEDATRIGRALRLAKGAAATLFQWTEQPVALSLALEANGTDWSIAACGSGLDAKIALSGGELRCELGQATPAA